MTLIDIQTLTNAELLKTFETIVAKGDYTRDDVDSDAVLYQILKQEIEGRLNQS